MLKSDQHKNQHSTPKHREYFGPAAVTVARRMEREVGPSGDEEGGGVDTGLFYTR